MKKSTRNRVAFAFLYNSLTSNVVGMVAQGMTTQDIAKKTRASVMTVAAIKANLTRNAYYPFAWVHCSSGRIEGTCKY
jgi:hypothetical protein